MISCFPDPYPNEIFYSVCARFQERMGFANKEDISKLLFGTRSITASVGLTTQISYLISQLNPGHTLTLERIIEEHTLFPLMRPFLTLEKMQRMVRYMEGWDDLRNKKILSRPSYTVKFPDYLRFCPLCLKEDKKNYGEYYWHREHQVVGIEVCPVHDVFLEQSDYLYRNRANQHEFVTPEKFTQSEVVKPIDLNNANHKALKRVSQDALWLLNNKPTTDLINLKKQYVSLATVMGFTNLREGDYMVCMKKMVKSFKEYFSTNLLEMVDCKFNFGDEHHFSWLSYLIYTATNGAVNPIRHLLLIQFLGKTAEEFFSQQTSGYTIGNQVSHPFGEGPWPCLNPICKNYKKLVVIESRIYERNSPPDRVPCGEFTCKCGYSYRRLGYETVVTTNVKYHLTIKYGSEWEEYFRQLWNDPSLYIKDIAKKLKILRHNTKIVLNHANRVGLPFPRKGPPNDIAQKRQLELREQYRNKWLEILRENSTAKISFLTKKFKGVHSWLIEYDNKWFLEHKPIPAVRVGVTKLDWAQEDLVLSEKIRETAELIKNLPGRPLRVCKMRVAKRMKKAAIFNKQNQQKLPLCCKAITEVLESQEQISIRRILWAAALFRQEKKVPARYILIQRAAITSKDAKIPSVKETIDLAWRALQQFGN